MKRPVFNLLTAAALLTGSLVWLASGSAPSALFWAVLSMLWFAVSFYQWFSKDKAVVANSGAKFRRRISRFVLFWS